ncbi:MAG: S-methyl-5'-thioadenosine phosphorylase, partial [Deltaproteobacteria bacterium]|nr:S-methyl-5'-thioadenosine phosphorylase [Deltaproteobacteria bacterium]
MPASVESHTNRGSTPLRIGIIGGSGLYEIDGLVGIQEHNIQTPFGAPSSPLVSGRL